MNPYLDLLRHVLANGQWTDQRAVLADGTRPRCLSVFGTLTRYDLTAGFPLVTTKRVPFRHVAEELFWMLSGSTNVRGLQAKGVRIWDEWADPETGSLGPIYGKQWRSWDDGEGFYDQIDWLVQAIGQVARDPNSRFGRQMILSAWNVADLPYMKLPPCHVLSQFVVRDGRLSCKMDQRSADLFLGVPFNVASYALLTHLLAHVTGLRVGDFVHTIGDAHIYENHMPQVQEQLTREPRPLPTLSIHGPQDIDDLRYEHLTLTGYDPWPTLKAEVAV